MMTQRLLTVKDVAARMSVSVRAVWNYRDAGRMPSPVKVGGAIRWRESDIDLWIAAGCPDCKVKGAQ